MLPSEKQPTPEQHCPTPLQEELTPDDYNGLPIMKQIHVVKMQKIHQRYCKTLDGKWYNKDMSTITIKIKVLNDRSTDDPILSKQVEV